MKKLKRLILFLDVFFLIFSVSAVKANDFFDTECEIEYKLQDKGVVQVKQQIYLTNKEAGTYPAEYTVRIVGMEIGNIQAEDENGNIVHKVEEIKNGQLVTLRFNKKVAGKGKTLDFWVGYQIEDAMTKNGEVWEVNLPFLPMFKNLQAAKVTLVAPFSLGPLAYISPTDFEAKSDSNNRYYVFTPGEQETAVISAAFGRFQIFDFQLQYHLSNTYNSARVAKIALPPDTFFQKVYLENILPLPQKVEVDLDGNWLGVYQLKPKQQLNVKVFGWAQIFSSQREEYLLPNKKSLGKNLLADKYWEVDDPEIVKLAKTLKTPERIYYYVVNLLDYDYDRVKQKPKRRGALLALENPQASICMEFTDLFIALCRAAGIPAREINGYAYTANSKLRPLSLVSDVLHSWPEYWDEEKQVWQPVDPTWEKTTGGRDYFNRFDLNHFAFAIHGQNSQLPLPAGSYKLGTEIKKDIEVEFGEYRKSKETDFDVDFLLNPTFFHQPKNPKIEITNLGSTAIYDLVLEFETEGVSLDSSFSPAQKVKILPPFSDKIIEVKIEPFPIYKFGQVMLTLTAGGRNYTFPFQQEALIWPKLLFSLAGVFFGLFWTILLILFLRFLIRKSPKWI